MKFSDLGRKSIRRNALIADLLHRITFIEKAVTGIKRMREEAQDQHCPAPIFEENGFFTAIFYPNPEVRVMAGTKDAPSTAQVGPKSGLSNDQDHAHDALESTAHVPHMYRTSGAQVAMLRAAMEPNTRDALQLVAAIRHRQHFYREYLHQLLEAGLLELTIPDKPRSSKQRYRITPAGREMLEKQAKESKT